MDLVVFFEELQNALLQFPRQWNNVTPLVSLSISAGKVFVLLRFVSTHQAASSKYVCTRLKPYGSPLDALSAGTVHIQDYFGTGREKVGEITDAQTYRSWITSLALLSEMDLFRNTSSSRDSWRRFRKNFPNLLPDLGDLVIFVTT